MNNVLLISENTIKKYSLINDNLDGKYLLPSIQIAQEVDLVNLIGQKLVDKLCLLVKDGSINEDEFVDYKVLLDDYITDYLIWQVMVSTQLSVNYKISNSGVYGQDDEHKNRQEYKNAQLLVEQYQRNANAFAKKLKTYIKHNSSKYPEYYNSDCCERPEEIPTYGIYLGDIHRNNLY